MGQHASEKQKTISDVICDLISEWAALKKK